MFRVGICQESDGIYSKEKNYKGGRRYGTRNNKESWPNDIFSSLAVHAAVALVTATAAVSAKAKLSWVRYSATWTSARFACNVVNKKKRFP